jgi:hypothetical protein
MHLSWSNKCLKLKLKLNLDVFVVEGYLEWMYCDESFSNLGSEMLEKSHHSWFVVDASAYVVF